MRVRQIRDSDRQVKGGATGAYLCDSVGVEHFNRTGLNLDSILYQHHQSLKEREAQVQ